MIPVEISIVTVDPATIEAFQQTLAASFNFSEWIKLLNMYKHNQMWRKVDECIKDINSRFVVKESFWLKELEEHWNRVDYEDAAAVSEFWELMKLAFENEFQMREFGEKLAGWVVHVHKSLGRFTLRQAELKMEWLIEKFRWDIDRGAQYYEKLRELYSPEQTAKIRAAYHAEFRNPFNSNDVMFDEYRTWETDAAELKKAEESYEKMLYVNDQITNNVANKNFAKLPVPLALKLMHEDTQYNEDDRLEVIRREPSTAKRAQLLRREAKEGRLETEYLEELGKSQIDGEEELVREYSVYLERTMSHGASQKIELLVRKYLCSLVRRINRHLSSNQPQEYLDSWGEKVTFFRQ